MGSRSIQQNRGRDPLNTSTYATTTLARGRMLKLYHAEPVANSLKTLISFKEKGLAFESVYIDLHKFQQHEPWFVAVNAEGQVPVLEHDGQIITHTTVIAEYLEDAFPDAPPLRPGDALGKARMRYWNKFC